MPRQRTMSAQIVFETDPSNMGRTNAYVLQSLKSTFSGLKNANVAIAVFDEAGIQVGIDITGNPSDEMKKLMELEFGEDQEVAMR